MKHTVVWRRVDTIGLEYAEIEFDPLVIEGRVVVVEEGTPFAVSYRVTCDASGVTQRAAFRVRHAGHAGDHELVRLPTGSWTLDGALQHHLEGLMDVDLSVTPSTNIVALRRLRLATGQQGHATAAWVRFPSIEVTTLRQSYRRVSATAYEYEAPDLQFTSTLDCDEAGIVQSYAGLWAIHHPS